MLMPLMRASKASSPFAMSSIAELSSQMASAIANSRVEKDQQLAPSARAHGAGAKPTFTDV